MGTLTVTAEIATIAGESVALLQAAAAAVPPIQGRRRANRSQRRAAYLAFQRAALDAMSWANYIPALDSAVTTRAQQIQLGSTLVRELGASRASLSAFLGALAEIRMGGNPKPRKSAEEITALTAELFGALPMGRPAPRHRWAVTLADSRPGVVDMIQRIPVLASEVEKLRASEARWQHNSRHFADCLRALGLAHRDFTMTARDDLGDGRRWWQRGKTERVRWYQLWCPPAWPGGWPGPDAHQLIAKAKELNSGLELSRSISAEAASPPHPPS